MNNCSVALQVLPQINNELFVCGGSNKEAVFKVVDEVIKYIDRTGVKYTVSPFETVMEGDFDELMSILKEAQRIAVDNGASSVLSYIKLSYNPEGVSTIEEKTDKYK
ncbi:thiamine-binding protein [Mycoplasmatota bacterium WC44]